MSLSTLDPMVSSRGNTREDTVTYLQALFGWECYTGHAVHVAVNDHGVWNRTRFLSCCDVPAIATVIAELGAIHDTYVAACPRARPERGAAGIARGWALWCDLDGRDGTDAAERLHGFTPEPSMIVRTSPHSVHCYWVLDGPRPPESITRANTRLVHALDGDPKCAGAHTVLRPPGTLSVKNDGFPVTLELVDGDRLYTLRDVVGELTDPPEKQRVHRENARPRTFDATDWLERILPVEYAAVLTGEQVGRDGKINCPFHGPERTPSLHVYDTVEEGWTCFGSCPPNTGGGIYQMAGMLVGKTMPLRGQDFLDVKQTLQRMFSVTA